MIGDDYLTECKIDPGTFPPYQADAPLKLDLRDPRGINSHLKMDFSDVLAEPSSFHSFDKVWTWSDILFESSKLWCYRIISLLCAVPVSLITGFLFACLGCLHIWCVMPCSQFCTLCMPPIRTLWASILDILLAPLCSSIGRCCGSIYLTVSRK
ncbi:caveolin-2-like [Rhinatrema bivittatum]|uniref:caveolin-2-like n=1 Tax=Rhinatrema bivittatum TaxID=194408 RepID=UPI00112C33FA|nr:caveolin-2-like [Rhinatrema bivittatum]